MICVDSSPKAHQFSDGAANAQRLRGALIVNAPAPSERQRLVGAAVRGPSARAGCLRLVRHEAVDHADVDAVARNLKRCFDNRCRRRRDDDGLGRAGRSHGQDDLQRELRSSELRAEEYVDWAGR